MENDLISKSDAVGMMHLCLNACNNFERTCVYAHAIRQLEKIPTVDAVTVVRCKDCKNFDSRNWYCYYWDYEPGSSPNCVDDDDFCSHGERKEEDAEPPKEAQHDN